MTNLQSVSLDIFNKKYRLKDKNGSWVDQTIEDTFKRVARALANVEKEDIREEWYEKFLWAMNNGAIPAGRILSNAGATEYKPSTSTINCTVSEHVQDSMDGILHAVHQAGLTLHSGAGIGYCFSTLRPKGAFVSGAGSHTSGPLSFMEIFDKMCQTVSSAGGRRGAQMATFDVSHPDILEFIRAKREDGRLRQFNLSVLVTKEFMEAVENDAKWVLSFPIQKNHVKDKSELADPTKVVWRKWPITEGYFVNKDGLVACKVYKELPARRLWDAIMSSTYDYAEPGFILIDEVNSLNNNWWCEEITATNPCVTGETRLHTDKGMIPIRELYDSKELIVASVDTRTLNSKPDCIGVVPRAAAPAFQTCTGAEVFAVETEHGYSINATDWHDFYTTRGKIELRDLKVGDQLLIQSGKGQFGKEGEFQDGYAMASKSSALVPDNVWKGSEDYVRGYLQALYEHYSDLSGVTKGIRGGKEEKIRLFAAYRFSDENYRFLKNVQILLSNFGILSKVIGRKLDISTLIVSGASVHKFMAEIGFPAQGNRFTRVCIDNPCSSENTIKKTEHYYSKVVSIEPLGIFPVYDTTQPDHNSVIFNGIVTGQCGEQPLPPNGSCLLGSINLTKFVEHPFTEQAKFDWKRYIEVVEIFTRMLDNVVEINGLPLPEQRNEITRKRRHGMGYLGLGSTLTMLKIPYGSPESIGFTERVTRELALVGWKVGVELAKEKGVAPIFEDFFEITPAIARLRPALLEDGYKVGEKVSGKILFSYSHYMEKIREVNPALPEEIKTYGCRFTHHSSIAPTGTISLSLGNNVSNGVEPSFAHQYSRNVIQEGRKTKEKVDVFSYEFLEYRRLIDTNATVDSLPSYFVTASDIPPKAHADIQSAAQKWVDSSISKTINVPTDFPYEEFKEIYRYAYKKGLKGCTTFRYNPAVFQGVLVKDKDLEATKYRFVLDTGEIIELKGNEEVEYEGETHTAANLFDAMKEGYYGKL